MKFFSGFLLIIVMFLLSACPNALSDLVFTSRSEWIPDSGTISPPLTVNFSSPVNFRTNVNPVSMTISFSEGVSGFSQSDLIVADANIDSFVRVNDSTYTFNLVPTLTAPTTMTLDLPAGVCKTLDLQRDNQAASQFRITYEVGAPTVMPSSVIPADGEPAVSSASDIRIQFNEMMRWGNWGKVTLGVPAISYAGYNSIVYEDDINCNMTLVDSASTSDTLRIDPSALMPGINGLPGITFESIIVESFLDYAGNTMVSSYMDAAYDFTVQGLTLYMPMDGDVKDYCGLGLDATGNFAALTTDAAGNADSAYYQVQGMTNRIMTNFKRSDVFTGDYTVSFWMNPDFPDGELRSIINKDADAGKARATSEVQIGVEDRRIRFITGSTEIPPVHHQVVSNQLITMGNWYHVTCVMDTNMMSIYINGNPESTPVSGPLPANRQSSPSALAIGYSYDYAELGAASPDPGTYYKGSIDDLRIYNYALSAGEILDLFNTTKP